MRQDFRSLWISEDKRLSIRIGVSQEEAERFPFRATISELETGRVLGRDLPAEWVWRDQSAGSSTHARKRLDHLSIELGTPSLGQTYILYFARDSTDSDSDSGFQWVPLEEGTPLEMVRIVPDLGPSFNEAVLSVYDEVVEEEYEDSAWVRPYRNFRAASKEEIQRHMEASSES